MLQRSVLSWAIAMLLLAGQGVARSSEPDAEPAEQTGAAWELIDQFNQRHRLENHAGEILLLVYGDRKATKPCRELGEAMHVEYHPTAAHLPPAEGHLAPVKPLAGQAASAPAPNVRVVPIACTGKVPPLVRPVIIKQFRKACPDVPVWLDFTNAMKDQFGIQPGEPNVVLFDGEGQLRWQKSGTLTVAEREELSQQIDELRIEAARLIPRR